MNPIKLAQPSLTGGDDQPETPCTRDVEVRMSARRLTGVYPPSPFDLLIEERHGSVMKRAAAEALTMCSDCPLRDRCLVENRDEEWVRNMIRWNPNRKRAVA